VPGPGGSCKVKEVVHLGCGRALGTPKLRAGKGHLKEGDHSGRSFWFQRLQGRT